MVRAFLLAALLFVGASADDLLYGKIESLIGERSFQEHRPLIRILFSPSDAFYRGGHIDTVQVIETLKENGLMELAYGEPRRLELTFSTVGTPLFFVKLMEEALRSVGYYRYTTEESRREGDTFSWKVALSSERALDPSRLHDALIKRGCLISDISREGPQEWRYEIDMLEAHLLLEPLQNGSQLRVRNLLDVYWMNIAHVQHITMNSLGTNNWYPYVAFYDGQMHLLKVYKRNRKTWQLLLRPPRKAVYAKVGDLYSIKNIKDGFHIVPRGLK